MLGNAGRGVGDHEIVAILGDLSHAGISLERVAVKTPFASQAVTQYLRNQEGEKASVSRSWDTYFRRLRSRCFGTSMQADSIDLPLPKRLLPPLDRKMSIAAATENTRTRLEFEVVLSTLLLGPVEILRKRLESFRYVGPLRAMPSRNFEVADDGGRSGWPSGLAAWQLLAGGGKQGERDRGLDELLSRVNAWLEGESKLGTGYRLERTAYRQVPMPLVERMMHARSGKAIEGILRSYDAASIPAVEPRIYLRDIARDLLLHPRDVGVGFSQLVPVVAALLQRDAKIVSLEQPELHLHPRQQAAMGDLLIEAVKASSKRLVLVETHSEYMTLRLLRRIRETGRKQERDGLAFSPKDMRIHYAARSDLTTVLKTIDVDVEGELVDPWPDDFFEQDFKERFS